LSNGGSWNGSEESGYEQADDIFQKVLDNRAKGLYNNLNRMFTLTFATL